MSSLDALSRACEKIELAGASDRPLGTAGAWQAWQFNAPKSGHAQSEDGVALVHNSQVLLIALCDGRGTNGPWADQFEKRFGMTPGRFASSTCVALLSQTALVSSLRERLVEVHLNYRDILASNELLSEDCAVLPSTSLCAVMLDSGEDSLEIAQIGDSAVIIERLDGSFLTLDSIAHAAYDRRLRKLADGGASVEDIYLKEYRSRCNTPQGLGVSCFNGAEGVLAYLDVIHCDLRNVRSILVYSDGLLLTAPMASPKDLLALSRQLALDSKRVPEVLNDDLSYILLRRES